jgi:hypothetical protein
MPELYIRLRKKLELFGDLVGFSLVSLFMFNKRNKNTGLFITREKFFDLLRRCWCSILSI